MTAGPKKLVDCRSIEVLGGGGSLGGSADLNLHPVEHADALLWAQEAIAPRHGIKAFHDASKDGRRHALMVPVNAIIRGLNHVAIHDPLLEGWMGVSPPELARYMLWAGYDTLLIQQVPVLQSGTGLGRWKQLETFVKTFARAWEDEAQGFLEIACNLDGGVVMDADTDSRGSRTPSGGYSRVDTDGFQHFGIESPRRQRRRTGGTQTTVNPMMAVFNSIGGTAAPVTGYERNSRGNAGRFWPFCIRAHTANILVENGDAFVHHAFEMRHVDRPWWFAVKGIVLRNRHLDVKGLFSHSYASDVYRSRLQIASFIEGYVEDDNVEELESTVNDTRTLWSLPRVYGGSRNAGQGRRLAMFAIEDVDVTVNIDAIDLPPAIRRVVVGEEFNEEDMVLPRPFSSVDVGHFLMTMQTKSIPALVSFALPPALSELKLFRDKQEPISLVQYLSHPVFAEFEPNMPRVAGAGDEPRTVSRSASSMTPSASRANKGVRWADQQIDRESDSNFDPLGCPNLEAFLDAVENERRRTGAADWSGEGEEEGDWIEAVVEQLRTAKREAFRVSRSKAAAEAASRPSSMRLSRTPEADEAAGLTPAESEALAAECAARGVRDVPEWIQQQLPALLKVLEAARLLVHEPELLQSMVDATHRVDRKSRRTDATPVGKTTPARARDPMTPTRSRLKRSRSFATPTSHGKGAPRTPGRDAEDEDDDLIRTYEEDPLPVHWADVDSLGKSDTLHSTPGGPELLEDQLFSAYLEYSVGQPRLGTRSSSRAKDVVLTNLQWLVDSESLSPLHFDTERCGPVKSDLFKAILAKFAALARMLQTYKRSTREKDAGLDSKEEKEAKAAVHALLCWISISQVYSCMSALAAGGGADVPKSSGLKSLDLSPMAIEVFSVERQALTFTGGSASEEHYAFHAIYKETSRGLSVYVSKDHPNQAAGVLWCYLRWAGVPVMMCHLAECLMDRTLNCRWDPSLPDELFRCAALKEGAMRLGYQGELRPLSFLSKTCKRDIERDLPILERGCLLRMLSHGHRCLAEYTAAGPGMARSRTELAAFFRIVSAWRVTLIHNLRNMPSSRYLYKFEDHLRLPNLTIHGTLAGHRGTDPRRVLWWTWLAIPWSPSARTAIVNLLTVINRAPPPSSRSSSSEVPEADPRPRTPRPLTRMDRSFGPGLGHAALDGQEEHGMLWKMFSDLFVTRLGTCMLLRSLVLENRDESPYPPFEKHYHIVALELRGADKTAVFDYLRTDAVALGEVLNRVVRADCLASDHSQAFLASKTLGTLHDVKHGKSGTEPLWLETGYGGRLRRLRDALVAPKDSSIVHGYSVGMYYSLPVLIELLLQLTSGGGSSIYSNSQMGQLETVVPIALLHSLVVFGGLALGAAKISSVNFYCFMVIKLVLAQIQFLTVFIVGCVVLLPIIAAGALLSWIDNPILALAFVIVFLVVGAYIMLVSLILSTTGGKPWSSSTGRVLLLAHAFLLVSPVLASAGVIPKDYEGLAFMGGVVLLMSTLAMGFTFNTRRLYNMTLSKQVVTLSKEEWQAWEEEHRGHQDPTALFFKRASSVWMAWWHPLTRKRRFAMMASDLEEFLLGFDAIRSAQSVPERWSKQWDDRLARGHEALVAVNRGAGVETASTVWAMVKWDVLYGVCYFLMVFTDNMINIWTRKKIVDSDEISMMALGLFIIATAGLESMMMVNLGRANGWRFWRMDPEFLSMSEASRSVSSALHKLYLWDFATYLGFLTLCIAVVFCVGYWWLLVGYDWDSYTVLRAIGLITGYVGILIGLFHKILFGGSVSRQKASVLVSVTALAAGYGAGLGLIATNAYLGFSDKSLSFAALGFTGFFYALFSMFTYREFRVQLNSRGFASGQLLSTPSLGTAGQRCLGVSTLHLDGREARATESCRSAAKSRILTQMENKALIQRTLFGNRAVEPSSLWSGAPKMLRAAFGNKMPRNEDFFRWTISPVPDRCILEHGMNALVDPEQDDLLYVAESVYADRNAFAECLMHETYEWAYGSHQVGVLSELLRDPLPSRMRRQIASETTRLPLLVDRTLPCCVDVISMGCLKNEVYWRDLSPHAREVVLRMLLTQPPVHFRHVETSPESASPMIFSIDVDPAQAEEIGPDPLNDVALAVRLGCRNGNVLGTSVEEASLGLDPQVVVSRASLLAGLAQCVMRYALAHISAGLREVDVGESPSPSTRQSIVRASLLGDPSVEHLQGRQRVWGAMVQAHNQMHQDVLKNIRLSNAEALLNEVETVFPTSGAFHLDYMLFGAASGCMGFDREAFALMLDQNPKSLPLFVKMHRVSRWLNRRLLHHMVLKTDSAISDLLKAIDSARLGGEDPDRDPNASPSDEGAIAAGNGIVSTAAVAPVVERGKGKLRGLRALVGDSPATERSASDVEYGCQRLIEQRRTLEGMIRDQDLPIAFSSWFDQRILRMEPLLADYWEARDKGRFSEALVSLKLVQDQLVEGLAAGVPAGLSTYTDLATFAKCGTTIGLMKADRDRSPSTLTNGPRTSSASIKGSGGVTVVAMDSGTWPLYGGGVSVCRKQLLDDTVGRVRWNTLFEVALPAPVPKNVETPSNVRQMLPVPLWSQNAGGAYETFLAHTSFITRSLREARTTSAAINAFFMPQLKTLIDLANTPGDLVSVDGLEIAAQAIAEIYCYFQVFDWETTWRAGTTHDHWAASWLACAARDKQAGPLLASERPNLAELHEILNYWQTLLTCLQVQLPEMNEENRGVIHVSHHGTQALVGVVAKRLSGWSLVVWDHGMLWRERCKAISELHSSSLFVRKSLISLHRLVAKVALYEADMLTPCTQMNKPWELRVVAERDSEVRDLISRKVNPVLNGAPASITPNNFLVGFNADNKNEFVTVVMLSHVYALKGVLTAIMAADAIINRYGLKKYRILIYGSTTHDVVYCRRCQDTIDRLKLNDNVKLMGKGKPSAVLAQGDMFLNSSVSEGLPLAIIEASRAGLVVVATDVGGTRDVVGEFGGICRPNSPLELAKTQLETLAACKKWCKTAGAPNLDWSEIDLSSNPGEILERAIFNADVINARHDWGARYLEWTSKAFTLDRYRDEHVRALWFADRQAQANCARLTLDWGCDPGSRRLALAYLRLSRLLEVADRKEHTTLGFIASFGEVRTRIKEEMRCRTPIELSTDADQLALMSSFHTEASFLPILKWIHGEKSSWNGGYLDGLDGAPLSRSGSVNSCGLEPIEESDQEEAMVPPITCRSDSASTTPRDPRVPIAIARKGTPSQRTPAGPADADASAKPARARGSPEGHVSPSGEREVPAEIESLHSRDSTQSSLAGEAVSDGRVDMGLPASSESPDHRAPPLAEQGADERIQRKLNKLEQFERLDRELVKRIGIHLRDIGGLTTAALNKLLRDTAPSPPTKPSLDESASSNLPDGAPADSQTPGLADPLVAHIADLLGPDIISSSSKTSVHDWLAAAHAEYDMSFSDTTSFDGAEDSVVGAGASVCGAPSEASSTGTGAGICASPAASVLTRISDAAAAGDALGLQARRPPRSSAVSPTVSVPHTDTPLLEPYSEARDDVRGSRAEGIGGSPAVSGLSSVAPWHDSQGTDATGRLFQSNPREVEPQAIVSPPLSGRRSSTRAQRRGSGRSAGGKPPDGRSIASSPISTGPGKSPGAVYWISGPAGGAFFSDDGITSEFSGTAASTADGGGQAGGKAGNGKSWDTGASVSDVSSWLGSSKGSFNERSLAEHEQRLRSKPDGEKGGGEAGLGAAESAQSWTSVWKEMTANSGRRSKGQGHRRRSSSLGGKSSTSGASGDPWEITRSMSRQSTPQRRAHSRSPTQPSSPAIMSSAASLLNVTRHSKARPVEQIPPRRRNQVQVMYPAEGVEALPVEAVPAEVRKERARQRRELIEAMASSRDIVGTKAGSMGSIDLSGSARGGPGATSAVSPAMLSTRSGSTGAGSARGTPRQMLPPELERPLPFVRDVLANKGNAERGGARRSERASKPGRGSERSRRDAYQLELQPPLAARYEEAAAKFARQDSAEEDGDDGKLGTAGPRREVSIAVGGNP